jgi:hypothetical protein
VAVEVLGAAVNEGVHPQFERILVDGRGKGVVRHREHAALAPESAGGREVHRAQERV